ncbi:MAG: integrase [Micavibrio sp.]|nr:integrase [Micavibrio sp.]
MGLEIKKRKGSPYWYIRGTVQGIAVFESTGLPHADKVRPGQIVEDFRDKRVRELEQQSIYGRAHIATFHEAATSYLTAGGSPRFLGKLITAIGDKNLRTIDQGYLNRVAAQLYPDCSAGTVNRQFWTPFIAVWNHASKGNNPLCPEVKWQRPHISKKPKPRKNVSYEDAIAFINAASWPVAKIMFFLFWTGCRPDEAFSLKSEDIYPENRWANIAAAKTDTPRGIPLHECLVPLLTVEKERGGHMFLSIYGKPYASKKVFNKAGRLLTQGGGQMKTAIRNAQVKSRKDIIPYNARHTVSTYLIWPGGVNPHIKDEILGHADAEDMSKYYTHLPRQPLIDAINVLPDARTMGLREDLWNPCKIRAAAKKAYRNMEPKQKVIVSE